ncbi:hypothetical protein ACFV6F_17575 [Kitasatospora phosalacinea]|uniref:hypothetical protein n=1 Tax=Kitasatospora phosalacinea TaxID=2065 RepID=UPI00365F4583
MVEVPWGALASKPRVAESLIGMLLLRLRPMALPVDGVGGDGGRDLFECNDAGELINYEIKSFTGRMVKGRRDQVRKSLISTAQHQPDHWDLFVPIDPNPAELKWFEGLRGEFPFVRHWHGLTWLNAHFAAHPDLVRSGVLSSSDEILKQIGEARAERDLLMRGVPDFADRYAALVRRADEVSTHYSVRAASSVDGTPVIEIIPKSQYIPEAAQITFTGHVIFREDDPEHALLKERFEDAVRFGGDDVQLAAGCLQDFIVAAPAELGISGPAVLETLQISQQREQLDPPAVAVVLVREQEMPAASLQILFTQRSTGLSGGRLYGADLTGAFKAQLRLDASRHRLRFQMTFDPPERAMPTSYIPALRFMAAMLQGRSVELLLSGRAEFSEQVSGFAGLMDPDAARRWADAFDDLARLQSLTGRYFQVPEGFNLRDAREVRDVLALLNGERVQLKAETVSVGLVGREALAHFSGDFRHQLAAVHERAVYEIGGNEIELGTMVQLVTVDRAVNLEEASQQLEREGEATLDLRVAAGTSMVRYLGSELPGPQ